MAVVVSERRPVPLFQHVMVGHQIHDLFAAVARRRGGSRGAPRSTPRWSRSRETSPASSATILADRAARAVAAGARSRYGSGAYGGVATPDRWGDRDQRPRSLAAPRRAELVTRLDADGLLPAIVFIFSRAGCDAAARQLLGSGLELTNRADQRRDPADPRPARRGAQRRRPAGVGLPPVRRGAAPGHRGPPRRHAAGLQGVRGGGLRPGAGQGGLRHRDPRPGHQHAGPQRRAGEAGQVQRRDTRRHHAGRVHPADGPGRAAGDRRRGARRRACGSRVSTRERSPASRRAGPIRCAPPSSPRTTWRSTSSPASVGSGPGACWSSPLPSSSPIGPWSGWPVRSPVTTGPSATPGGRPSATSATSRRTRGSGPRSRPPRPRSLASDGPTAGPRCSRCWRV